MRASAWAWPSSSRRAGVSLQGAEGAQRAAQAPQADAQLVGGGRVLRLQHRRAVGGDLVGGRPHDEGEGLGAGVVGWRARGSSPRCGSTWAAVGLAERQAVAALGLAALGEADGRGGEQLGRRLQQALGRCPISAPARPRTGRSRRCRRARRLRRGPARARLRRNADGAWCAARRSRTPAPGSTARPPSRPCGGCGGCRCACRSGSGRSTVPSASPGFDAPLRAARCGLDRLQPAVAVRSQAEGDAQRPQAVVGRIEVDRAQRARDGLADGRLPSAGCARTRCSSVAGELELELQLTFPGNAHRQLPDATAARARGRPWRAMPAVARELQARCRQCGKWGYPQEYRKSLALRLWIGPPGHQRSLPRRVVLSTLGCAICHNACRGCSAYFQGMGEDADPDAKPPRDYMRAMLARVLGAVPQLRQGPTVREIPQGPRRLPGLRRGAAPPPRRRRPRLFHHPDRRPFYRWRRAVARARACRRRPGCTWRSGCR